ncbi:MAG: DNA mismatch repair protein MutS [Elusimicrobiota bacterium]|jgi:DNA mismatch repair protein MutS|nr:DNA mismatch repair protein MutS [Elusimicrobiota bacterium]
MKQYWDIKSKYPNMILMFRLGDFYEMFADDAVKAAPILEVVLTQRTGLPMCGVPYHALNSYLKKLISKGLKAAICDQLEDSKTTTHLIKRGVTRVITPGTILEDSLLEAKTNNFLMSIYYDENLRQTAFAAVDISTGDFFCGQCDIKLIGAEISKYNPGEIIVPQSFSLNKKSPDYIADFVNKISQTSDSSFDINSAQKNIEEKFGENSLKNFELDTQGIIRACGAVLSYLKETQPKSLEIFSQIKKLNFQDFMQLDSNAIRNLEILNSLYSGKRENSLLSAVDQTKTSMGARTIRQWILKPLLDKDKIINRLNAVQFFIEESQIRKEIVEKFKGISDIERIMARIASQTALPRDLIALRNSLTAVNEIDQILSKNENYIIEIPQNHNLIEKISLTLIDEPPINLRDANFIKSGVNEELDELRRIAADTKGYISELESKEKQSTGINNLRIRYNSVFGYYIELTKSAATQAPQHYIRKQTLANVERYITQELKNLEEKILSAQEKIIRIENAIFISLRQEISLFAADVLRVSQIIAEMDVYCSFAQNAEDHNYTRPQINDGKDLNIINGRHPVLEQALKDGEFVSNDINFNKDSRIAILTGPNMSGKSTYLRQTALIVIMAQIGSFIPAESAQIGIVDKIFTRIGAGDNLAGGESTFMVEMTETANILRQYTDRSLIILDEVGRGTSTYDGMSIAWAILEFFADKRMIANNGSKILFATHYFELTSLENKFEGIINLTVLVKEWEGEVVFLHKIVSGSADKSYGIHVAKIAGLPHRIIQRAYRILEGLETQAAQNNKDKNQYYLDLFVPEKPQISSELEKTDLNNLTPMDALNLLKEWKEKYK